MNPNILLWSLAAMFIAGGYCHVDARAADVARADNGSDDEDGGPKLSTALDTSSPGLYGEMKKWHRLTLAFEGADSGEQAEPNPFTNYRLDVTFTHPASGTVYVVPGYYAADGHAAETGAAEGSIWRAHFSPDQVGAWEYEARFRTGSGVAVSDDPMAGRPSSLNGDADGVVSGTFAIEPSDKSPPDNRARGRLQVTGSRYLRYADTGEWFLKQGPDAPENLLAYEDFDGEFGSDGENDDLVKSYAPHAVDWKTGDPAWGNERGTELIGAINYLASEGLNVFSFLTMNINGDDRNVFPYTTYDERERMDVSRLDQWEIVFDHADRLGFFLHFKTQETENETLLDDGALGPQRKLYYRELIARFGHHLALNWNLGEENSDQTDRQRKDMARFFADHDPYGHLVVLHTYPGAKDEIYTPLLGDASALTGVSLQGSNATFGNVHGDVLHWIAQSSAAGKPWVVSVDEPGGANHGVVPDSDNDNTSAGNHRDARHRALWGTLMAGGTGNEWYFGYEHDQSDLTLQDFRSRDLWWDNCRHALRFFREWLPFQEMQASDELVGASGGYGFAKHDEVYAVYLPAGKAEGATLDLTRAKGTFSVYWYNPRDGGSLRDGTVSQVTGGDVRSLGAPPEEPDLDWAVLVGRLGRE